MAPIKAPSIVPEGSAAGRSRYTTTTRKPASSISLTTLQNKVKSLTGNQKQQLKLASAGLKPSSGSTYKPKTVSTAAKSTSSSSSSKNRSGYSYSTPTYKSSSSGRSGGGGSGGGSGALAPVAWNPTGLAANYLESAADLFAKDPTLLLRDLAEQRFGADGGAETIIGQLGNTIDDANALYLLMQGQDAGQGTNAEWINWLGSFIDQQLTPGQFFNTDAAIRNMFNAVPGSPLQGFLGTGDSLEQGENFSRLLNAALDVGFHPLMAEGIRNQVERERQQHAIASAKAAVDPFITYLKAQNPDLSRMIGAA